MTGSLSSYSDFEKHYTPSNTTNTEHFRMLAWESFINIDCFSKSLTLDQLITFAESEVVNVRRTAEIKISELLEDELSKEDLEKIASCNNETVACVARAIIWKDNDVTIEDITSKYGGTEEENGHAALAYYLTGSSISEEALDEKGDIGHYEKITGKNGGGAALKRSKSASKYPKKK